MAIPESVRRRVLIEAGYRCAVPTCRSLLIVDLHHIVPVRSGGAHQAGNLLALCPTCHALFERGKLHDDAIRSWKAVLVALSSAFDRSTIDDLLFLRGLHKDRGPLAVSGDGIGKYSQLFAARLAEYRFVGSHRGGLHGDFFEVRITNKGLSLLAGWESGSEDDVRAASVSS